MMAMQRIMLVLAMLVLVSSPCALLPSVFLAVTAQSTPESDCALRSLVVEFATFLASRATRDPSSPLPFRDFATSTFDSLRLGSQCGLNYSSLELLRTPPTAQESQRFWEANVPASSRPKPHPRTQEILAATSTSSSSLSYKDAQCPMEFFVDGINGKDSSDGTINTPFKTIARALQETRELRASPVLPGMPQDDIVNVPACITMRAGIYFLGDARVPDPSEDSRVGAIHLTAVDSNLTFRAYGAERVQLSGGVALQNLTWAPFKLPSASPTAAPVYRTKISPAQLASLSLLSFNELFVIPSPASSAAAMPVESQWGIRAKYPNGDLRTHGLHTVPNSGWLANYMASKWTGPHKWGPTTEVEVQSPQRDPTFYNFPRYNQGVGGAASFFVPPTSVWAIDSPDAGSQYTVPTGVTVTDATLVAKMANWSRPTQGMVLAYHGGRWGSWAFEIANLSLAAASATAAPSSATVSFGRGGFQEARGANNGGEFYFDHILEELDDALEFFVDSKEGYLYFQPNATSTSSPEAALRDLDSSTVIASQLPCIISMVGSAALPVSGITIQGIEFAHTASTFMREYSVPSGGDWSIHRGATLYLEGTMNANISGSFFTQLGSNAVVVYGWNLAASIENNEFLNLGDTAIVLLGATDGIDGISNLNQPTLTTILSNHIHETGVYIKQSAGVVQFLSRSSFMIGNLMYNMPRAGININDGFAGGTNIHANAIFNTVRETGDHGPINTWDRLPYLTTARDGVTPSLKPADNVISFNLLFNAYSSVWPIDHDDGTTFYNDHQNVLVYGGGKNYLGGEKNISHNLYIHPDSFRFDPLISDHRDWGVTGWENASPSFNVSYQFNEVHMALSGKIYAFSGCDVAQLASVPATAANDYFLPRGLSVAITCNQAGKSVTFSLADWQKATGLDKGSTEQTEGFFEAVLNKARDKLTLPKRAADAAAQAPNPSITQPRAVSAAY